MKSIATLFGFVAAIACASAPSRSVASEQGNRLSSTAVKLRCAYRAPTASAPTGTAYVEAAAFGLGGTWANISINPYANLFYTEQRPDEMRLACERTFAMLGVLDEPVQWTAAEDNRGAHHQIWYDGVLSPGRSVERIVAFGDSLSDTGNFHNSTLLTIPSARSWFLGRFSNGPVWTEYLARRMDVPLNTWAIGNAETDDSIFIDGLESQIDSFEKYMERVKDYDPSRTLFTVLAGANDFMSDKGDGFGPVVTATQQLEASLSHLGTLGARRIALLNLPDISRAPRYRGDPVRAAIVRERTRRYNAALPAIAAKVAAAMDLDIRIVDMFAMFEALMENPLSEGFTNVTESCLDIRDTKWHYVTGRPMRPACVSDNYVFWDLLHPTTAVHRVIAARAYNELAEAWPLDGPGFRAGMLGR